MLNLLKFLNTTTPSIPDT